MEFRIDAGVSEGDVEVSAVGEVGEFQARAIAEEEVAEDPLLAGEVFFNAGGGNAGRG